MGSTAEGRLNEGDGGKLRNRFSLRKNAVFLLFQRFLIQTFFKKDWPPEAVFPASLSEKDTRLAADAAVLQQGAEEVGAVLGGLACDGEGGAEDGFIHIVQRAGGDAFSPHGGEKVAEDAGVAGIIDMAVFVAIGVGDGTGTESGHFLGEAEAGGGLDGKRLIFGGKAEGDLFNAQGAARFDIDHAPEGVHRGDRFAVSLKDGVSEIAKAFGFTEPADGLDLILGIEGRHDIEGDAAEDKGLSAGSQLLHGRAVVNVLEIGGFLDILHDGRSGGDSVHIGMMGIDAEGSVHFHGFLPFVLFCQQR